MPDIAALRNVLSRMRGGGQGGGVSFAEVTIAYDFILGRPVESVGSALAWEKESPATLIISLLKSEEFAREIARPVMLGGFVNKRRFRRRLSAPDRTVLTRLLVRAGIRLAWGETRDATSENFLALALSATNVERALHRRVDYSPKQLAEKLRSRVEPLNSSLSPLIAYEDVPAYLAAKTEGALVDSFSGLSLSADKNTLVILDNDPWIQFHTELHPQELFLSVEIDWELLTAKRAGSAVYLDYGAGYTQERCLTDFSGLRSQFTIGNPGLVRRIRWDPDVSPGELIIRSLTFRPVSALELAISTRAGVEGAASGVQIEDGLKKVLSAFWQDASAREQTSFLWTQRFQKLTDEHDGEWESYRRWIAVNEGNLPLGLPAEDGSPATIAVLLREEALSELDEFVAALRAQTHSNWELLFSCTGPWSRKSRDVVQKTLADPRIQVKFSPAALSDIGAINDLLKLARGDLILRLSTADLLAPEALAAYANAAKRNEHAKIIYGDEDKILPDGFRYDPFFKPEFSPITFWSHNFLGQGPCFRTGAVKYCGGWREGFQGSEDYDLVLRMIDRFRPTNIVKHIPKVLIHRRGEPEGLPNERDPAVESSVRAVSEHLARQAIQADVQAAPRGPYRRISPSLVGREPRVSIIIPTRDRADLLRVCVRSVLERTNYYNYDIIIVDNGSSEQETFDLFNELCQEQHIRVLDAPGPFNYSAINNTAAESSKSEIICLMNNDIEVISPEWLTEMLSWAVQPDVGCVGAKLYYPDDTVQHAGVIVGLWGVAGHSHKLSRRDDDGYFGRLRYVQEMSAVTAACLLVRNSVFWEVGGLDERLAVAFNDVDFCLKVREAGYRNVFTPFAELYHHESVSRGLDEHPEKRARFESEVDFMKSHWKTDQFVDPFYSPNLTTDREDFGIA